MRTAAFVATGALLLTAGTAMLVSHNGTAADAACADVNVVVARGTGEPGQLGAIVGDPVFAALQQAVPNKQLTGTAVNYPASLAPGSAGIGNTNLVAMVTSAMAACPNQRFVLVDYSQGANVVDNSLGVSSAGALVGSPITAMLPAAAQAQVDAVLLFGNPIRALGKSVTGTYQSRTIDFCAKGDPICENGGGDVLAHLGYTADADAAADFAASLTTAVTLAGADFVL